MKKNRPGFREFQCYINRDTSYYSEIDLTTFDLMNDGNDPSLMTLMFTGCLDALDDVPTGSMVASNGFYSIGYIDREISLEQLKELDELFEWMGLSDIIQDESTQIRDFVESLLIKD